MFITRFRGFFTHSCRCCSSVQGHAWNGNQKILLLASVASMIDQFNMPNIRLLQELGYEVHVACNFRKGNTCDAGRVKKLRETLDEMGVRQHAWDCPRKIRCVPTCFRAYRQLAKFMDTEHFAWIHCHSPIGGALARIAAHRRGIRVIYTAHGFHFYKGAPLRNWLLFYPIEKLLARWTDVLVTVNKEDYRFAKQHLKAKAVYRIPGVGIDTAKFRTGADKTAHGSTSFRRKYQIPPDARLLLSVGELNGGKNHRMVILALAELARKDIWYLICGQGELQKELQDFADRLGVGGRVCMPGYLEDLQTVYHSADLFVFPSLREGMPVALMEAMAAGLPCVVSDIRGNRELIGGSDARVRESTGRFAGHSVGLRVCRGGIRFQPGNAKQLREALERLLKEDGLRRAYGMYNQIIIENYSQEAVDRRMRAIYTDNCAFPKNTIAYGDQ